MSLKITDLKIEQHLPGANELMDLHDRNEWTQFHWKHSLTQQDRFAVALM